MGNPQAMLNQMVMNNPKVNEILKANDNDVQKAFYSVAKENGIDPEELLSCFK